VDAVSGRKFSTINPADNKVIAEVSEGDKVKLSIHQVNYNFLCKNCTKENTLKKKIDKL